MKKIWLTISLVLAFMMMASSPAYATYMVIPYNKPTIDAASRTHFIIASKGNDLGYGPQLSALTKAGKLAEIYPNDQVILFFPEENEQNIKWIKRSGFAGTYRVDALLDTKKLFEELAKYSQIVSIHTYGHSAIPEGVFLDAVGKRDIRWYPNLKFPERIVGHFTSDAFVTLNGCNLGHSMAPMLSRLWRVPVAGALVGTHFETLMPDGRFAFIASEKNWAKSTMGIYRNETNCIRGCVRMRPDNGAYDGHYGKYRQGLPFYKFFCSGISEDECLKGMARSLNASITATAVPVNPTLEQFAQAAREWLCPTGSNPNFQKKCEAQLAAIQPSLNTGAQKDVIAAATQVFTGRERYFSPFYGASHQCTFAGCYQNPRCLIFSKTKACAETEAPLARTTTFVDEYENYLKGYALLAAEARQ